MDGGRGAIGTIVFARVRCRVPFRLVPNMHPRVFHPLSKNTRTPDHHRHHRYRHHHHHHYHYHYHHHHHYHHYHHLSLSFSAIFWYRNTRVARHVVVSVGHLANSRIDGGHGMVQGELQRVIGRARPARVRLRRRMSLPDRRLHRRRRIRPGHLRRRQQSVLQRHHRRLRRQVRRHPRPRGEVRSRRSWHVRIESDVPLPRCAGPAGDGIPRALRDDERYHRHRGDPPRVLPAFRCRVLPDVRGADVLRVWRRRRADRTDVRGLLPRRDGAVGRVRLRVVRGCRRWRRGR